MTKNRQRYRLDNSGILHLAVHQKDNSNYFRFPITLRHKVKPELLQIALENIAPRFPMIVAGIQDGLFHHYVVPVESAPIILPDTEPLAYASRDEIRKCAMRLLYSENQIIFEAFHSLTDGYGSMEFLKSLLAEYLYLAHGVDFKEESEVISPDSPVLPQETEDSYIKYAGKSGKSLNAKQSYVFKYEHPYKDCYYTTTLCYNVNDLLTKARHYHTTLTGFITAVMSLSVMEYQLKHEKNTDNLKPVQIMIPMNLRKYFPSKSLLNFTLFVLPSIQPDDRNLPFEKIVDKVTKQLRRELEMEHLSSLITTNVRLQQRVAWIPLKLKCLGLRIGYHFFGSKNSCLCISNLGEFRIPEKMQPYISDIQVFLNPKIRSGYNCGMITYDNKIYINFSRCFKEPDLENILVRKLRELGCAQVDND